MKIRFKASDACVAALSAAVALSAVEGCCRYGVVDNQLFRARELSHSGGIKVLVLGDSYVAAPRRLSGLLSSHFVGSGGVVLNLARSGMRPADYLDMLERYGPAFAPDLILLNYTAANDLTDTRLRTRDDEVRRLTSWNGPAFWFPYLRAAIRERWASISSASVGRVLLVSNRTATETAAARSTLNPFLVFVGNRYPDFKIWNLDLADPDSQAAWKRNEEIFDAAIRVGASLHAFVLIDVFPDTLQVNLSHHDHFRALGFTLDDGLLRRNVLQDRFSAYCRTRSVACLDLLPLFRRRAAEEFYVEGDDHFNGRGDDLAFEAIAGAVSTGYRSAAPDAR